MSIRENPTAFLNPEALQLVMTADQLDLPQAESVTYSQPYVMAAGEKYQIYSADLRRVGHYVVRSWSLDDRFGALAMLDNVISQSTVHLSTSQLIFLEQHRRIRPDNGKRLNHNAPGAALRLNESQEKAAAKYLGYVEACFKAADEKGVFLRKGLMMEAVRRHAVKVGDAKGPCYNTIAAKIKEYSNGTFDPLLALVPKASSGNQSERFCDKLEELIADAVEKSWRLAKGDWKNVKSFLKESLNQPQNRDLRIITHPDGDRFSVPSDRTIQRRFGAVDQIQSALWRHDPAFVKKHFDIYIRQALPDHPLDIVDTDFTPVDVIVIDDERPIIYGRPHLIAFRDRKTGSILGWAVSFAGARFEVFLEALKMAIMPKDMSRYPGLEYPQFGTFLRLGVDNDMALINDHVRFSLPQMGIQLIEYRPGHPWEKGAMERLFGIVNQDVIHNLPGSTMSNPEEREKFKEKERRASRSRQRNSLEILATEKMSEKERAEFLEKQDDIPKVTLSELNDFLMHYICGDYHLNPHKGLGMLRTLDGIPNQLWKEGIRHSKDRRPFDPDIFIRLGGNTNDVAIRNGSVRWDNLIYTHPDLVVVQADSRNKTAKAGVATTKYKAWRDPSDIGVIYLIDHFNDDRVITVPVQSIDAWYARGLRLYQHEKVMEYLREQNRDNRDFQGALDDFAGRLEEINRIRTNKRTRQALARFHTKAVKKYTRSRVVETDNSEPSGSDHMELVPPRSETRSKAKQLAAPPSRTMAPDASAPWKAPADDVPKTKPPRSSASQQVAASRANPTHGIDLSLDDDDITHLLNKKDEKK